MHSSTNVTYNLSAASYRGLVMPSIIKKSAFCKTPLRQNQNESSGENKSQTSEQTSVFQNVNQAAAKQTYFTLWLAAKPKQVMCLLAYVCPLDKLIRLSPQRCFILDEFIILLPGKSTTISQANTICISHIYLLNKLLKL